MNSPDRHLHVVPDLEPEVHETRLTYVTGEDAAPADFPQIDGSRGVPELSNVTDIKHGPLTEGQVSIKANDKAYRPNPDLDGTQPAALRVVPTIVPEFARSTEPVRGRLLRKATDMLISRVVKEQPTTVHEKPNFDESEKHYT